MCYEQSTKEQNKNYSLLYEEWLILQKLKARALENREILLLHLNSQSDPHYIELILMKELGLIREGEQKVFLKKS